MTLPAKLPAFIRNSIRRKTMFVVLATTFAALVANAIALLAYDFYSFRSQQLRDQQAQAEILGRAAGPAIAFNDRKDAQADLASLRAQTDILAAALYTPSGERFATFERGSGGPALPREAPHAGQHYRGNYLLTAYVISEAGQPVGSLYLVAHAGIYERILAYVGILLLVMPVALGVSFLLSAWLQRTLTGPILAIDTAARSVVERRDFTVRARKTTDDEIGVLAEAFNRMLVEVEKRQEELAAADRRKDEFLATLAHELRNPLAPMRNALHLMKMAPEDGRLTATARDMMDRQLAQMVRLMDDLIDVSRITTGKLALRREMVELGAVLRGALEAAEPLANARGHRIDVRLPQGEVRINADGTRLGQVFLNLLNNAIKFTEPGGRVSLDASVRDGWLEAKVADSGIGIAPEMLESIFEMFAQADRSLERTTGGLGVGLALARRIVELHGGSIEARSRGLGQGSEFMVRMPVAGAGAEREEARSEAPGRALGSGSRVLLVDDNRDFAESLAIVLRTLGHQVRVAHDGPSGIEAARDFRPEVAFLDIGMPGMSGYDLARELRAARGTAATVLVAITGFSQPADRERAREAGFDDYYVKPVEISRLKGILEGRSASRR
jgi:signal transduction histidine kinase/CheY-like chemotaxis protein